MAEEKLQLVCGVGAAEGDTESAEQPTQMIDLVAGKHGFRVRDGGWSPQAPPLKHDGTWADSRVAEGRELVFGAADNVVETLTLMADGATPRERHALESELHRFAGLARDFWQTDWQIEPVYLLWWAERACAPQYALVYRVEIAPRGAETGTITLTVEREPYWRAVRPGGHPKEYTFFARGLRAGVDWDYGDLIVEPGVSDNLFDETLRSEHAWLKGKTAHRLRNFIDLPGELIPGDAPALTYIAVTEGTYLPGQLIIARSTKPTAVTVRGAAAAYTSGKHNLYFTAADGALSTDASLVADAANGRVRASDQNRCRVDVSFGTTTSLVARLFWSGGATIAAGGEPLDYLVQRGRFMAFALNVQNGGAAGDVELRLVQETTGTLDVPLSNTRAYYYGGTEPSWTYLGTLSVPPAEPRVISALTGGGVEAGNTSAFDLVLEAKRSSGSATLRLFALALVPIDEACLSVVNVSFADAVHIDGTGYLSHGRDLIAVTRYHTGDNLIGDLCEVRGTAITLLPGVTNRLYVLDSENGEVDETFSLHINLVPRWTSARDDCPLLAGGTLNGYAVYADDLDVMLLDDGGFVVSEG